MVLNGEDQRSTLLRLNSADLFFEHGRTYAFMTISRGLGHVHSADLVWQYAVHPLNPLTWRLFSRSRMFVNR